MLLVLADDFSGASEIGGIGHRYGLTTEIQLTFNGSTKAELVVLDTDTRSLSEAEAVKKMKDISLAIKSSHRPIKLFKKIDSVLRGHVVPEINLLQYHFRFERVILLPANPGRGRTIVNGNYFVNETPLAHTVFASDPHFPMDTSDVSIIVNKKIPTLEHIHLKPTDKLPATALLTGDVLSKDDLRKYLSGSAPKDLCCGGAELFEAYLEHLGNTVRMETKNESMPPALTLVINGSTVKHESEDELFARLTIKKFSLPGQIRDQQYFLVESEMVDWLKKIVAALNVDQIAAIRIDHPSQSNKKFPQTFLHHFIEMIDYITRSINVQDIQFCITGGATASAIIRHLARGIMQVKEEVAPGVVTLMSADENTNGTWFTVKPGSYRWPESWIETLSQKQKNLNGN
jgi:D-threonate/D-erythronate kinase